VFSFATGEIPSTRDFNRDGYTDTIAFVPSTGNAIVGINQLPAPGGGPWFSLQNWGYVYWSADLPEVGDFNGDGYSDTIAFNTQGRAIVGINRLPITGQPTFSPLQDWGYVFWYGGPDIPLLGDFNADGRSDTIAFNTQSRAIVGINLGSSFTLQDWGVVFSFGGFEIPSTGDFNGDGRTDTFARRTDGQAIIGLNQGSFFSLQNWGIVGAWGEIPIVALYDRNSYPTRSHFSIRRPGVVTLSWPSETAAQVSRGWATGERLAVGRRFPPASRPSPMKSAGTAGSPHGSLRLRDGWLIL
jgi:hypothetical protein